MDAEKLNPVEGIAIVLLLIGGLNWLLVGVFEFNLVTAIFGEGTVLARVIFAVVGLATVYVMSFGYKLRRIRSAASEIQSAS